jgi:carboxylate-amine ligase
LDEIERTIRDGNHASVLRKQFAQSGSVQGVVRASVDALRSGPA